MTSRRNRPRTMAPEPPPVVTAHPSRRVVVAPDKFKGTLSAAQVAAHLARGLACACPGAVTTQLPVADGGDGTVDAAVAAGYRRVVATVRGPTGEPVTAAFAIAGDVAIIEAAQACGLTRLAGRRPAPLTASSEGVGDLVGAAVDAGARRIVLGLGGVATTDGGAGMVRALGARLLDAAGRDIGPGGAALADVHRIDLSGLRDLSGLDVLVASDVDNPLLGPEGAAAVYGPQKGASPREVPMLERGLARWADVAEETLAAAVGSGDPCLVRVRDRPAAGAAGGLGFAALAFLGARVRPGIELMLELLSFDRHVAGADLVVTGEGSIDAQTLRGKAPIGVAAATARVSAGTPVVAVAGRYSLDPARLEAAGIAAVYALTDIEPDVRRCFTMAGPLLEDLASRVAHEWL